MIPRFWAHLTTAVLGLAVLAWPEQDSRMLLTLSERHGPSRLDVIGIALILVGYVPTAARVWSQRRQLRARFGVSWAWLTALVCVSWAGIAGGLMAERELVLWTSVAVSTLAQALLVVPAFRRAPPSN